MIDITKFFIIKQDLFNSIIAYLNCNLLVTDKEYTITFLFANFLAYFLIIFTLIVSIKMYKSLYRYIFSEKFI